MYAVYQASKHGHSLQAIAVFSHYDSALAYAEHLEKESGREAWVVETED